MFHEFYAQKEDLVERDKAIKRDAAELERRHRGAVLAIGRTYKLDFPFNVELNRSGTALNYTEVLEPDDETQGEPGGAGPEASAEGDR